jgi:hypothetical protein
VADHAKRPQPKCPIRLGEPCSLCVPGATGPEDCALVYLVMSDPALRDELRSLRVARSSTPTGEAR